MIYKPVHQEEEIFAHKTLINLLHSFDAEQYSLGSSIYELYRPTYSQKPLIDIVLIHGNSLLIYKFIIDIVLIHGP